MKRIYISKYPGSTSNLNYKFILLTFCLVGNKPQFRNVEQNLDFFFFLNMFQSIGNLYLLSFMLFCMVGFRTVVQSCF